MRQNVISCGNGLNTDMEHNENVINSGIAVCE